MRSFLQNDRLHKIIYTLDIDYLKIDQSFIQNLHPEGTDNALCEAIIMMAHKLGILVIAEGVETEEQHALLMRFGCDMGQGYYYHRPQIFVALVALRDQTLA